MISILRYSLPVLFFGFTVMAWGSEKGKNENVCTNTLSNEDDLFLEEVRGAQAMEWVEKHNSLTRPKLVDDPRFAPLKDRVRARLDAPDKLIAVSFSAKWAYNFWQDKKNPRGLWRRMPIQDYLRGHRVWELLLDIDELARTENKNWVYSGANRFKERALISLSDGGKDAKVVREFDMTTKKFVHDGFNLPEGKHNIAWINENEVFLGLAVSDADKTDSGYPRTLRTWHRGTNYESAPVVFTARQEDVSVSGVVVRDEEFGPARHLLFYQMTDFFNSAVYLWKKNGPAIQLPVPSTAEVSLEKDWVYVQLKTDWEISGLKFKSGSLVRAPIKNILNANYRYELLFEPTANKFIDEHIVHKGREFLILSEDVNSRVVELKKEKGKWVEYTIQLPKNSSIETAAYSKTMSLLLFHVNSFLNPPTVFAMDINSASVKQIDQGPVRFDPDFYHVQQFFAKSLDGTMVPYYVIHKKDIKYDGENATILTAYGGFEVSETPYYLAGVEESWLSEGGVWVVANIRGGGEYGPEWHRSALKENRHRAYEDFFAVTEDLFHKKISKPEKLGAVGGSNGGLLMGVAMTQRPHYYNAIAIQVPLLDMLRYHQLLAGASWQGEYGSPDDPAMRKYLESYSPYHNLKFGVNYPEVFFMTSTADDRVHPAHARRMAARMEKMKLPFYYYENTEGGHGGSANNEQRALWAALEFTYFKQKLMDPK